MKILFWNTLIVFSGFERQIFRFLAKNYRRSCQKWFPQVQRKALRKSNCSKRYTFKNIFRLSSKSSMTFGRKPPAGVIKQIYSCPEVFLKIFNLEKKSYSLSRNFKGNFLYFLHFSRHLLGGLPESLSTSPVKKFQEIIKFENCNSTFFSHSDRKFSDLLVNKTRQRCQDCTSF